MSVESGRLSPAGVERMFDRVAPVYDLMNRVMTAGLDRRWRELTVAQVVVPGDRDRSRLYTRVLDGEMPPRGAGTPPVPNRDLARLGGFIDVMLDDEL